jgi:hypothetical protein
VKGTVTRVFPMGLLKEGRDPEEEVEMFSSSLTLMFNT